MSDSTDKRFIFESLFKQYYQRLCSYAFTFLNDIESSEDVVQELFIYIWENQKPFFETENIKFYLFTAVRNNCLKRIQKNSKIIIKELDDYDATDEITILLDEDVTDKEPKVLIAKAMNSLPPKCREVFMLSRMSGFTYQQIADALNISVKTVENQMGKAIRMMKSFAKENGIYVMMLTFLFCEEISCSTIGVFLKNGLS
ncbi:MAG: RNA polymerase sigma-70 factor [Bacteroidetes bacterium]|nr:RNA polymerase sigma-70 factor [Bacteroidota bacterium]